MGSVECQFQARGNAELVKNIGEVMFDRLRTESQPVGDIFIRTPGQNRGNDLQFARGEAEFPIVAVMAIRALKIAQRFAEIRNNFARHPLLAGHDGADGGNKHVCAGILENKPTGAEADRFANLLSFQRVRQHYDTRRSVPWLAEIIKARRFGINKKHMWFKPGGEHESVLTIRTVPNDAQSRLGLEQLLQPFAEHQAAMSD
jgi:hypothetical protein